MKDDRRRTARRAARAGPRTARDVRRRTHGQNFLRSASLVKRLVDEAGIDGADVVLEPGAGTGAITEHLAERAERVVAIEVDPDWCARLRERFAKAPNVEVRCQDFLDVRLPGRPYRVFGNVPFGATTKFLRHLLDDPRRAPTRADLIVQLEVARKHASRRSASALTASWQPWYEFRVVRRIPAAAFRPVPRIDAALLAIAKRADPLVSAAEREPFSTFVYAAFSRPTVREGLRRLLTSNQAQRLLRHRGLAADVAPSALTVDDWAALFNGAKRFGGR